MEYKEEKISYDKELKVHFCSHPPEFQHITQNNQRVIMVYQIHIISYLQLLNTPYMYLEPFS